MYIPLHTKQDDEQLAGRFYFISSSIIYDIWFIFALFFIFSTMRMTLTAQQCGWLFIVQEKFLLRMRGWFCVAFRGSGYWPTMGWEIGVVRKKNLIRNWLWFYCCVAELNGLRAYCACFVEGKLTISPNIIHPQNYGLEAWIMWHHDVLNRNRLWLI